MSAKRHEQYLLVVVIVFMVLGAVGTVAAIRGMNKARLSSDAFDPSSSDTCWALCEGTDCRTVRGRIHLRREHLRFEFRRPNGHLLYVTDRWIAESVPCSVRLRSGDESESRP